MKEAKRRVKQEDETMDETYCETFDETWKRKKTKRDPKFTDCIHGKLQNVTP
jgi:hypothetical protein